MIKADGIILLGGFPVGIQAQKNGRCSVVTKKANSTGMEFRLLDLEVELNKPENHHAMERLLSSGRTEML